MALESKQTRTGKCFFCVQKTVANATTIHQKYRIITNAQILSVTFSSPAPIMKTASHTAQIRGGHTKELTPLNYLLGEKIARARNAKKLTQEQLARQLNISRQTISHWENDDSQPNVEMLLKLMQVLELEAGDLLKVE